MPRVRKDFHLDPRTIEQLETLAKHYGISVDKVIEKMIDNEYTVVIQIPKIYY